MSDCLAHMYARQLKLSETNFLGHLFARMSDALPFIECVPVSVSALTRVHSFKSAKS